MNALWDKIGRTSLFAMGGGIVGVSAAALVTGHYDLMRGVVVAQLLVAEVVMTRELLTRSLPDGRVPPEYHRAIRLAYMGRIVAVTIFVFEVLDRFGHDDLNPLTPSVQLCLILWVLSVVQSRIRVVVSRPEEVVQEIVEKTDLPVDLDPAPIVEDVVRQEEERGDK